LLSLKNASDFGGKIGNNEDKTGKKIVSGEEKRVLSAIE